MKKPIFTVQDGNSTVSISPEEYAALWGCDGSYDSHPNEQNDGAMFYIFSSSYVTRTNTWLKAFAEAIYRTRLKTVLGKDDEFKADYLQLAILEEWVNYLRTLPLNKRFSATGVEETPTPDLSKPPSNCPSCGGQREYGKDHKAYCYFCGCS